MLKTAGARPITISNSPTGKPGVSSKEAQPCSTGVRRISFGSCALVAVVIGVGTAFTAANTFDANAGEALGYGTQTVSGANVTSMHYTLSADGTTVDDGHVHRRR